MRLLDCYLPVFKLAANISHRPEHYAEYVDFRKQCISCIEQAVQDAENLHFSDHERDAALFAVIIWLDETILCSKLLHRQQWLADLLQRKYFQTTVGGTAFFTRLNQLKDEDYQARLVFLFCMQSGFYGKYSPLQERSSFAALIEQQRQLCLPETWLTWPNDADITPVSMGVNSLSSSPKSRFRSALFGIVSLYGVLFLLGAFYFS